MKNLLHAIFIALPLLFMSCSEDDAMQPVGEQFTGETKTFNLSSVSDPSISGTATFMENEDNSTTVEISLNGTSSGMHPAHIHFNTAAEGGDIALSFEPIDGSTGISTTTFSALDDGTAISYSELINFDGYINVHLSAEDLSTLVAQGDIGQNELTGESVTYQLNTLDVPGIMGTAMFEERVNGETLVILSLENTIDGAMHPAHIHMGSVAEAPGDIAITLTSVNGTTGTSMTNVAAFNSSEGEDAEAVNYETLIEYDGYINVHLSAEELATLVAQGNIGANAS